MFHLPQDVKDLINDVLRSRQHDDLRGLTEEIFGYLKPSPDWDHIRVLRYFLLEKLKKLGIATRIQRSR